MSITEIFENEDVGEFEYDQARGILYWTTNDEFVHRINVLTGERLDSIEVGGQLGGISLSTDGSTLWAAQFETSYYIPGSWHTNLEGQIVEEIDLDSGTVTSHEHEVVGPEEGSFDVAVTSNDLVFWTSNFSGSGWNPFWGMNADTGVIEERDDLIPGDIRQSSYLITSENDSHVLILESNISSAPMHIYDAVHDRIIASVDAHDLPSVSSGFNRGLADISSAAGLIVNDAYGGIVFDFQFNEVARLDSYNLNGFAFSIDGSVLYAFDDSNDQVLGFDTESWEIDYVYDLSELLGERASDVVSLSSLDSGEFLTLELSQGYQESGFAILDLDDPSGRRSGTPADDRLIGTHDGDLLLGFAGNDNISGLAGNDIIRGHVGNDTLFGGDGGDSLRGGADQDTLYGGRHDDTLFGGDGADTLFGGAGQDRLLGGNSGDILMGQGGDDMLAGGNGNDSIRGGGGQDRLIDGKGQDNLIGGSGQDHFVLVLDGRADYIEDFELGRDVIDLQRWHVTPFGDFDIDYENDGTAVITYGGERLGVTFTNDELRPLAESDFIF